MYSLKKHFKISSYRCPVCNCGVHKLCFDKLEHGYWPTKSVKRPKSATHSDDYILYCLPKAVFCSTFIYITIFIPNSTNFFLFHSTWTIYIFFNFIFTIIQHKNVIKIRIKTTFTGSSYKTSLNTREPLGLHQCKHSTYIFHW